MQNFNRIKLAIARPLSAHLGILVNGISGHPPVASATADNPFKHFYATLPDGGTEAVKDLDAFCAQHNLDKATLLSIVNDDFAVYKGITIKASK